MAEKLEQLTTSSKAVSSKLPPSDYSSKFSTAAPSAKQPEGQNSKARFMQSKVKLLSEIMKTELLEDKDFEEIKQVLYSLYPICFSNVLTFHFIIYNRYGMNTSKTKLQCQECSPKQFMMNFTHEQCNILQSV